MPPSESLSTFPLLLLEWKWTMWVSESIWFEIRATFHFYFHISLLPTVRLSHHHHTLCFHHLHASLVKLFTVFLLFSIRKKNLCCMLLLYELRCEQKRSRRRRRNSRKPTKMLFHSSASVFVDFLLFSRYYSTLVRSHSTSHTQPWREGGIEYDLRNHQ